MLQMVINKKTNRLIKKAAEKEIAILSKVNHLGIVKFYGVDTVDEYLIMIFEYITEGTLYFYVGNGKNITE